MFYIPLVLIVSRSQTQTRKTEESLVYWVGVALSASAFDKEVMEVDIEARLSNGNSIMVNYRLQKFLALLAPTVFGNTKHIPVGKTVHPQKLPWYHS